MQSLILDERNLEPRPKSRRYKIDGARILVSMDTKTMVVMRGRRAVPLSPSEFVVYKKLRDNRGSTPRALLDAVYDGVKDTPLSASIVITSIIRKLNTKLTHLGISILTEQHGKHTMRKLVYDAKLPELSQPRHDLDRYGDF